MIEDMKIVLESCIKRLTDITFNLNEHLKSFEPLTVFVTTFIGSAVVIWVLNVLTDEEALFTRIKRRCFKLIKSMPPVQRRIEQQLQNVYNSSAKEFNEPLNGIPYITQMPEFGETKETILTKLRKVHEISDNSLRDGQCSGVIYGQVDELVDMDLKVFEMFFWSNQLYSMCFRDVRKLEAEVCRMCCNMMNGGSQSIATATSGGTESILQAILSYRDLAQQRGVTQPVMIIPKTAHPAFCKEIPVDPTTCKVDVRAMRKAITRNTCMLVGSAYEYAHGIIDPISEISELAIRYNIPLHVDCCLGGFILPFMERLGYDLPLFDFRLPGVTSISCDLSKYAYAPQGCSVIMFKNKKYQHGHYFAKCDWPGGIYGTVAFTGSRPGNVIAAAWATIMYYGEDGYMNCVQKIIETKKEIVKRLTSIRGVSLIGKPIGSAFSFTLTDLDSYELFDMLSDRGWAFSPLQNPPGLQMAVTMNQTYEGFVDRLISDVTECMNKMRNQPSGKESVTTTKYEVMSKVSDQDLLNSLMFSYMDAIYVDNYDNSEDSEEFKKFL